MDEISFVGATDTFAERLIPALPPCRTDRYDFSRRATAVWALHAKFM